MLTFFTRSHFSLVDTVYSGSRLQQTLAKKNLSAVNNWDLVDATAPKILGPYFLERDKKQLYKQKAEDTKS